MGLVSDGGVHGHLVHIAAAARAITDAGVSVVVHAITDGRDVAPSSARHFMCALMDILPPQAAYHGDRPLFRDGPRQSLGPGGNRLSRDGAGAGAAGT